MFSVEQWVMLTTMAVGLAFMMLLPSQYRSWYAVYEADGQFHLSQYFKFFGWRWSKSWYGAGQQWCQWDEDSKSYSTRCNPAQVKWLNGLVARWRAPCQPTKL